MLELVEGPTWEDSEGGAGFCYYGNSDCGTHTILSLLDLQIVKEDCKDVMRTDGFSNVPKIK